MIIVLGTPGAGKTTILNEAKKHLPPDWTFINYGDLMFKLASEENFVKHRDEMRLLPLSVQKKLQAKAAEELQKSGEKTILDTHCSIKTPNGYLPGLPFELLSKMRVENLILISAPIEDIMRRRVADTTRSRDKEKIEELEEHMAINKFLLSTYSVITGAPFLIIENRDGSLKEAVERFLSVVK